MAELTADREFPEDYTPLREADPYAFQAAHRRQAWLLRLSFGTIIIQGLAIIFLTSLITVMLPLKTIEFGLLRIDPDDNRVYRVEPISQDVSGFDLLLEMSAKRYVELLLEIDPISQTARMQKAFAMTDDDFYKTFQKRFIQSGVIQQHIDDGLQRSVVIESADRISEKNGVYQYAVDFRQIDRQNNKVVNEKKLRAYLSITTRPHEVTQSEKYENPFGIRILDLVLKPRSNS